MGNRGRLHDHDRRIVRWADGRRWIICALEFKGRRRTLMSPTGYTELFFADEATALAAGHRPCAECRREAYVAYRDAWSGPSRPTAEEIDTALDQERRVGSHRAVIFSDAADLPTGSMIDLGGIAGLVWGESVLHWTPDGYTGSYPLPERPVPVLTPTSSVVALRQGFRPVLHPSVVDLAAPCWPLPKVAVRSDALRVPFDQPEVFSPPELHLSERQWMNVRMGLIPRGSDDKWFGYTEGWVLHLHRSWTGLQVYALEFEPSPGGVTLRTAFVETAADRYERGTDLQEGARIELLLHQLFLGGPLDNDAVSSLERSAYGSDSELWVDAHRESTEKWGGT